MSAQWLMAHGYTTIMANHRPWFEHLRAYHGHANQPETTISRVRRGHFNLKSDPFQQQQQQSCSNSAIEQVKHNHWVHWLCTWNAWTRDPCALIQTAHWFTAGWWSNSIPCIPNEQQKTINSRTLTACSKHATYTNAVFRSQTSSSYDIVPCRVGACLSGQRMRSIWGDTVPPPRLDARSPRNVLSWRCAQCVHVVRQCLHPPSAVLVHLTRQIIVFNGNRHLCCLCYLVTSNCTIHCCKLARSV